MQVDFQKILRLCSRFLRPPVDAENVAANIVLECLEKRTIPSYTLIRSRCYDELRRFQKENAKRAAKLVEVEDERAEEGNERREDRSNEVAEIIKGANLTTTERNVVFLRFYKSLALRELSYEVNMREYEVVEILNQAMEKLKASEKRLR